MRDEQRQLVYDAESAAFESSVYEVSLGMFELSEAAARLSGLSEWCDAGGGVIKVCEARVDATRSCARKSRGEIRIAPGQDSVATLAHEAAHLISDDGHGPEYRRRHVEVLGVLAGAAAADKLAQTYSARALAVAGVVPWRLEGALCQSALVEAESVCGGNVVRERMRRRVGRLLAKAASTTEAEAESLRVKAFELARTYGVEDALAWKASASEKIIEREILLGAGAYVAIRGTLLGALGEAYGCRVVWMTTKMGRVSFLSGFESDVARVRALFFELDVAGRRAMAEARPVGNVTSFRRHWLAGYVSGVTESLQKSAERAVGSVSGDAALVLVERSTLVDAYMKQRWRKVKRRAGPRVEIGAAYQAGQARGRARNFSESLGSPVRALAGCSVET